MKMTKVLTTVMILGALSISTGLILAGNVSAKGPIPFTSYDADGNGIITEEEFEAAREKQQAEMRTSGRLGKGQATAPSFADVDNDKDGQISAQELKDIQARQQANRGMGRGQGKGQGRGYRK